MDKSGETKLFLGILVVAFLLVGFALAPMLFPGKRVRVRQIDQYKVSRGTVRNALQMLKEEGLLVSVPSKGTFVAKPDVGSDGLRDKLVAVLTPDVDTGYFSRIIRGIERQAYAEGFVILVHATNDRSPPSRCTMPSTRPWTLARSYSSSTRAGTPLHAGTGGAPAATGRLVVSASPTA